MAVRLSSLWFVLALLSGSDNVQGAGEGVKGKNNKNPKNMGKFKDWRSKMPQLGNKLVKDAAQAAVAGLTAAAAGGKTLKGASPLATFWNKKNGKEQQAPAFVPAGQDQTPVRGGGKRSEKFAKEANFVDYFGLVIGTAPEKNDVIDHDFAQLAFDGEEGASAFKLDDSLDSITFYLQVDEKLNKIPLYVQRPQVVVPEVDVTAEVVSWPTTVLTPIPKLGEGALPMTIQFKCESEGTGVVNVLLRVFQVEEGKEAADGNNGKRKEISFTFSKQCTEEEEEREVDSDALLGFSVHSSMNGDPDIVKDGMPQSGFRVEDGEDNDGLSLIEDGVIEFFVFHTSPMTVNIPVVTVEASDMLVTRMEGRLAHDKDRLIGPASPGSMEIVMSCLKSGKSDVTVTMTFEEVESTVSFSFRKVCNVDEDKGPEVTEAMVRGVSIRTKADGTKDVVKNGKVTTKYQRSATDEAELGADRLEIEEDVMRARFWVSFDGNDENDVLQVFPPFVSSMRFDTDERVLVPSIHMSDHSREVPLTSKSEPLVVTVEFECLNPGSSIIMVSIPSSEGSMLFTFRKKCGDLTGFAKTPITLPGFNIGLSRNSRSVVKNGLPTSKYHWTTDWRQLADVPADKAYLTFFLSINTTNPKARPVTFGAPSVLASKAIMEPIIIGQGSDGDGLDVADHSSSVVSITFHCLKPGIAQLTLIIPIFEDPVVGRSEPVKINFLKECGEDASRVQPGLGGVGITGFSIGLSKKSSEVVLNGFPTSAYFGQRTKDIPSWGNAMVSAKKHSVSLFLHFNSITGMSVVGKSLAFGAPSVISHHALVQATLSGKAESGAILRRDKVAMELTVNFKCRHAGIGAVTVMVPILPHGVVTFTIPKTCEGREPPQAAAPIKGLDISILAKDNMNPNGAVEEGMSGSTRLEVYTDGAVEDQFNPKSKNKKGKFVAYNDFTAFRFRLDPSTEGKARHLMVDALDEEGVYASAGRALIVKDDEEDEEDGQDEEGDAAIRAIEPMIFAHRPIANPSVDHDMHVSDAANDAEQMLEVVIEPGSQHLLNVSYHCTWMGTTPVTLTIPLLPKGKLSFTWSKFCEEEGDGYSDLFEEYSDLYNEDYSDEFSDFSDSDWNSDFNPGFMRGQLFDEYSDDYLGDFSDYSDLYYSDLYGFDDWTEWDELNGYPTQDHWDDSDLSQEMRSMSGYLNVGSSPSSLTDVVKRSVPDAQYKSGGEFSAIDRDSLSTSFYISVDGGSQKFGTPSVKAMRKGQGGEIVAAPEISGDALYGGEVTSTNIESFTIEYKCKKAGITPILVVIPLSPSSMGSVSFKLIKVCAGVKREGSGSAFYWTASRIALVAAAGVLSLLLAGACFYFVKNNKKNAYSRLPSSQVEDMELGAGGKKAVKAGTGVVEQLDDSDEDGTLGDD